MLTESFAYDLPPRAILARHPTLFADVDAIYTIKRNLIERLKRNPDMRRLYQEWVLLPAWDKPTGVERLTALIENWVAYTEADVFPGGCFVAATSVEFGHLDGPVAESVQRLKREWLQRAWD